MTNVDKCVWQLMAVEVKIVSSVKNVWMDSGGVDYSLPQEWLNWFKKYGLFGGATFQAKGWYSKQRFSLEYFFKNRDVTTCEKWDLCK